MRPFPLAPVSGSNVVKLNDDLYVTRVILRHIFTNSLSLATAVELLQEIYTAANRNLSREQIMKNIKTILETDIRKNPSTYNLTADDVRQLICISTLLR